MTLPAFQLLPLTDQLAWVLEEGTFLAQRWEEEGAISLYHLLDEGRGFFAEVAYDAYKHGAVVLRSFRTSEPLADYAHYVQLPEG